MTIAEAIRERHSVRNYEKRPIEAELASQLRAELERCNAESGLRMELVTDEPKAFGGLMARYGKFRNADHYIAIYGQKSPELEEKAGYYGERAALYARTLGLDSCWVALTFGKGGVRRRAEWTETLACVIALGYGTTHGVPHRSKPIEALYRAETEVPQWFSDGVEAARLAPTAMNRQKFCFVLRSDGRVKAEVARGSYAGIDLGIVKYHFEIGAGAQNFAWALD